MNVLAVLLDIFPALLVYLYAFIEEKQQKIGNEKGLGTDENEIKG